MVRLLVRKCDLGTMNYWRRIQLEGKQDTKGELQVCFKLVRLLIMNLLREFIYIKLEKKASMIRESYGMILVWFDPI